MMLTAERETTAVAAEPDESIPSPIGPDPRWPHLPLALSIGDQCIVSGLNFLTTVVVGRWCGLSELGYYSLAFTVVVVLMALQESLLVAPLTLLVHRLRCSDRRRSYTAATLRQQLLIAAAVCVILLVVSEVAWRVAGSADRWPLLLTLALVTPLWLLKDFARRVCFAELDTIGPLVIDGISAVVQISGLAVLAVTENLSGASVLMVAGVGHSLAAGAWFLVRRPHLQVASPMFWRAARLNWSLGSWSCAGRGVEMMHAYSIHWLLAAVAGPAATGAYAAANSMLALANPILMGIGNLLAPQTARAYARGGASALKAMVMRTSVTVTLVTLALLVVLVLFSQHLLFYAFGEAQPEEVAVIVILSVGLLAAMMSFGAENALRALARPGDNFLANLAGWCTSVSVAAFLIAPWSAPGAAWGALAGNVIAAGLRIGLYLRAMHRKSKRSA